MSDIIRSQTCKLECYYFVECDILGNWKKNDEAKFLITNKLRIGALGAPGQK